MRDSGLGPEDGPELEHTLFKLGLGQRVERVERDERDERDEPHGPVRGAVLVLREPDVRRGACAIFLIGSEHGYGSQPCAIFLLTMIPTMMRDGQQGLLTIPTHSPRRE